MIKQEEKEIFPNSKLTTVSFELRYYPLLEIDATIQNFQKVIRDILPNYRDGQIAIRDSKGIQEKMQYIFFSKEEDISLKITNYNLIIQSKRPLLF